MHTLRSLLRAHCNLLVLTAVTLVTYVAATNRLQTLPWGIAALLSATLLTGLIWPHWLIRCLSVTRTGPVRAEEGDAAVFHVDVQNHGLLPRFMVQVVDQLPFAGPDPGRPELTDTVLGVIVAVPGSGRKRFTAVLACEKRGLYRLGPVGLTSSFPLGLVQAHRNDGHDIHSLTIYPTLFPILDLPLNGAPSLLHRGDYRLQRGTGASEFTNLREYQRGDSPRHVHWPTTARTNELMVKEYEPQASACLHIILDCQTASNLGTGRHATFEYAARIAGSIARFATSANLGVRLTASADHAQHIPAGRGEMQFTAIMDALAVIDADTSRPYASVLERIDCLPGETLVLFLSSAAHQDPATLQALALLRSRRAHLLAIVFDAATFLPDTAGPQHRPLSGPLMDCLLDLGATCIPVSNGANLITLFNT